VRRGARAGESWSGSATLASGPNAVKAPLRDARLEDDVLSFAITVDRADVRFSGSREGEEIRGTVRALEGERKLDEGTWAVRRDGRAVELDSGQRVSPEDERALFAIAGDKHLKVSWQRDPIPAEDPTAAERPETACEREELRRERCRPLERSEESLRRREDIWPRVDES
jgi:hypothetical protein